jgi:hypothetical protein
MTMSTHPFDQFKYKNVPAYLDAEVAHYNLQKADEYSRYGDIAASVDAAMADEDRTAKLRFAEGWEADEGGWYTPNGISEFDWEHEHGFPFPEEAEWENFKFNRRIEAGWLFNDDGCWYEPGGDREDDWEGVAPEYCPEYCEA